MLGKHEIERIVEAVIAQQDNYTYSSECTEPILGYPILGVGDARIVLDLGDGTVLKVGRTNEKLFADYPPQNRSEYFFWKRSTPEIRQHLAPILAADRSKQKRWLIMPKADGSVTDRDKRFLRLEQMPFMDLHEDNVGRFGNQVKVIDYGRQYERL